jgi:predicted metal-dependent phosphoesterase TrpH
LYSADPDVQDPSSHQGTDPASAVTENSGTIARPAREPGDEIEDAAGVAASRPDGSQRPGSTRVVYHVHTRFSYDCATSLEAVLEGALQAGIGCLCVTDHDTIEGALALQRMSHPEVEIVVGCEFTAEDGSHVIGLKLQDTISERRVPELLKRIRQQGGLVLLPHPFRRGSGIFRNEMKRSEDFVREVLSHTDVVESFNGRDSYYNNQRSYLFATDRGVPAVAGSDAHTAPEIGSVFVEYAANDRVHGVSPRRVFFPAQRPVAENAMKKSLMELYHRHKASLPAVVGVAYRISRKRLGKDGPRMTEEPPRMQYEFPRAAARPGARREG